MVDQVTINQNENNPSLEEQANSQTQATTETVEVAQEEQRPEWLPNKFKDAQELAKAYSELEKKLGQPKEVNKEVEKAVEGKNPTEQLKINKQETEKQTGLNLDNFYNEFAETGELSEKSYEELSKLGLPKDIVDGYIEGQRALADNHTNSIMSTVGGKEQYEQMMDWASKNLSPNEIQAFNNTIDKGSLDQAQLAISGIQAKYNSANAEPNLFSGMRKENNLGYRSVAEMLSDINNPKYSTDEAFRKDVEEKVRLSNTI